MGHLTTILTGYMPIPSLLSSGSTWEMRPLLLVSSVWKWTHSPEGGWVMMWISTCRKRQHSFLCQAPPCPWAIEHRRRRLHLLPGQGHHVQGAVHETAHHRLGAVLREHGVVHAVVRRHVLGHKPQKRGLNAEQR